METAKERPKKQSIAALSPNLAWRLLTPTEQQLVLNYKEKVLEKEVKQEERPLTLTKS